VLRFQKLINIACSSVVSELKTGPIERIKEISKECSWLSLLWSISALGYIHYFVLIQQLLLKQLPAQVVATQVVSATTAWVVYQACIGDVLNIEEYIRCHITMMLNDLYSQHNLKFLRIKIQF